MFFTRLSVMRPVLMTMFIMTFVVLGVFSYTDLATDLFPEIEIPIVSVRVIYPGAGPAEVENLITRNIEEEVSAINGVETITSSSIEGASIVVIEFKLETNLDVAANDVKDKVELVKPRLPQDAEDPVVMKFDMGAASVVDLAVSSPRPLEEVYEMTDDIIKPELLKIDGLASVNIVGGKEREIQIHFDRELMRAQNLSVTDIIMGISTENFNIPSGHITEKRKEYTIRVSGQFETIDDIRNVILTANGGRNVRLRDVARVYDTFKEQRQTARFNDESSVGVTLIKRPDANLVEVADQVFAGIERLKTVLPENMSINVASDNSQFIRSTISEVINNIGIGILLTSVILYLFLHTWQGTLIAALAMPTSIISTFILIRFAGFTINFMTLLGLAVTVGVLVTNSIVVLENIFRYMKTEKDAGQASIKGTVEIATAVGASTLTNVVVFTPMAFMGGIIGQFFFAFGLTVAFATIFSFLIAITMTPMLSSKLLGQEKKKGYGKDIFTVGVLAFIVSIILIGAGGFLGNALKIYDPMISLFTGVLIGLGLAMVISRALFKIPMEKMTSNPLYKIWKIIVFAAIIILIGGLVFIIMQYLFNTQVAIGIMIFLLIIFIMDKTFGFLTKFGNTWDRFYDSLANDYKKSLAWALNNKIKVIMVVAFFFFFALFISRYIGTEFMAQSDQGYIGISIELPPGSNYDQTNKILFRIENELKKIPDIESYYTVLGSSAGTFVGANQGVQFGEITVKLVPFNERSKSTDDVIEELKPILSTIPMAQILLAVRDSGGGGGGAGLQIEITGDDLDELNRIASSVMEVADRVPGTVNLQSTWKEGVPEYQIIPNREKLADYGISVLTLASVMRSSIEGNIATRYRLGNKEYDVRIKLGDSYREFADQIKNISVKKDDNYFPLTELATVEFTEGPTSIARKDKKRLVSITGDFVNRSMGDVVADIRAETDQFELESGYAITFGGMTEMQEESFAELAKTLVLAVILSYMVLAAIMESFILPFIIMITLPLALVGVMISLLITGKTISIISLMAMVMLVGIVVNNAILMIDFIKILRERGKDLREAILEACAVRLRPIIMTNLATAISMLPLALGIGEGAEMRAPMAIVSIGALITSTTFTLYLIPVLYNAIEVIRVKSVKA
ncbi:efflux RND transporter permease subunit [candidate division KSB1 bacterium]